jgi:non-heme chloroperoxidase
MPMIDTADGTSLYVKYHGQGRPVVMLHGWPLTADTFDDLGVALAGAGLSGLAYDRRGFGRSDQPVGGYDYDTLANDLAAVLEQHDVKDATLLAFSMGGGEVARYLSLHGTARVRNVVLISAVVPYMLRTDDNPNGVDPAVFADMTQGMKADRAKFWSGFFTDFYGVGLLDHPVSDEVLEWSRNMAMQAGLTPTLQCAQAFATTDFRPDLKAFTVPTLIIHGTADRTVPIDATARPAAKAIASSTLIEYPGAAHGLLASHKEQLHADVLAFVR